MFYLLLAIISSALVSITMRFSNDHVKNNMVMFSANYGICTLLSAFFTYRSGGLSLSGPQTGLGFAIFLGVISGFMYLAAFILLQKNIKINGVALPATFMKLGVLVPTLMAIVIYHETPGVLVIIGFIVAIAAIIVINGKGEQKSSNIWLLVLLLITGGFTDSLANIYEHHGVSELKDFYLVITFLAACILCVILKFYKKQKVTVADLLWGALIGIPNYFSSRFLLLALAKIPAIIVYPTQNVGAILGVILAGWLIFKEKLAMRKILGILMIICALLMLTLS